jgi:hypothetical protein
VGCSGGEVSESPESSPNVLEATGCEGAVLGCGTGAVASAGRWAGAFFDSLGVHASSPKPSRRSFPDCAVAEVPAPAFASVAVDFGSNAFSLTTSPAGLAGVGRFFVLFCSEPPGPVNKPIALPAAASDMFG